MRIHKTKILLFIINLLLIIPYLNGQIGNIKFNKIGLNNGLSHSNVSDMEEDDLGFIWIATQDGLNRYDGYEFKTFYADKGDNNPSSSWITGVYEDFYGQLWINYKEKGIDRYNPYSENFITYTPNENDSSSISSNSFDETFYLEYECFYEDIDSVLWIATDKGLNKYIRETDSFISYKYNSKNNSSLSDNRVTCIYSDKKGNLWIGTQNGLNYFDKKNNSFRRYLFNEIIDGNRIELFITDIISTNDNSLIVGTKQKGIFIFPDPVNIPNDYKNVLGSPINKINEPTVYKLLHAANDQVFALVENCAYNLGKSGKEKPQKLFNDFDFEITTIYIDSENALWTVGRRDNKSKIIYQPIGKNDYAVFEKDIFDPLSYQEEGVNFIKESKNGLLWIGTEKGGIYKINLYANNFKHINDDQTKEIFLKGKEVYSIYKDSDNQLWVGTTDALNVINLTNKKSFNFNNKKEFNRSVQWEYSNKLSSRLIGVIKETDDGNIWLGSFSYKASCYNKKTKTFLNFHNTQDLPTGFNIWSVRSICYTSNLELYFGGTGNGLCRLNNDNTFKYFPIDTTNNSGTSSNWINIIYEDSEKKLWIGTLNGGLNCFDPITKKFSYFMHNPRNAGSISNNNVRCILESSTDKNILWIGTNMGLNKFNKGTGSFESYSTKNGLPNNTIYGILEDEVHNLWMSTNKGIVQFDVNSRHFYTYTTDDGLLSNEFNEGAYFKDNQGILYFGGVNGIDYFNPKDIKKNPFDAKVVITGLTINQKNIHPNQKYENNRVILNKSISYTNNLVLTHNDRILSFSFASLHMVAPQKIMYKYILEEFEPDWHVVDHESRKADYTNLPCGNYKLKILSTNNDGIWSQTPLIIDLLVKPPYWQRTWFKLFIIFIIFVLFGVILNYRTKVLRRQKDILNKQVSLQTKKLRDANKNLEKKNKEIVQISEQLHEADQMKLKFFTNISHEFRTPLTLIFGPVEQLLKLDNYNNKKEVQESLNIIYRNSNRLYRLINQLLEMSRVEASNSNLNIEKDDIIDFVHQIYILFIPYSKSKNINMSFESEIDSISFHFDKDKLEKIIYNLLINALQHTPENGNVLLGIKMLNGKSNSIIFTISDSGEGIAPEMQHVIFNRYSRVDNEYTGKISTGIGLSLVKDLVSDHKGQISIQSEKGKGTSFVFHIPNLKENFIEKDDTLQSKKKYEYEFTSSMLKSVPDELSAIEVLSTDKDYKILVVEDDQDLLHFLLKELNKTYETIYAKNGNEGIELAKEHHPDLIISDVMMPEMDGIKMCNVLKNDWATSHIPVFLLTAKSRLEQQIEGLESGADDYITKPFSMETLLLKIKNVISGREKMALRFKTDVKSIPEGIKINPIDHNILEKIVAFIEKNIDNPDLSGEMMSQTLGISKSNLYKKLKVLTGMSVNIFIRSIRLKVAAELLDSGNYAISDVAYAVGFNNPKYFSKCFSEFFNTSPTSYKIK